MVKSTAKSAARQEAAAGGKVGGEAGARRRCGAWLTPVPAPAARRVIDRFREEWARNGHPEEPVPLAGIIRHMVLAETEAEPTPA